MWIHRYATLCNALFSRTQSIPGKFMHQFWGWVVHHYYTDVRNAACAAPQFGTFFDFPLSFHYFVHSTISNFSTNSDDQHISTQFSISFHDFVHLMNSNFLNKFRLSVHLIHTILFCTSKILYIQWINFVFHKFKRFVHLMYTIFSWIFTILYFQQNQISQQV